MGDCLAVALLERRGFKPEDFRFLHPGGVIGRSASRRVEELMHEGDALPRVGESAAAARGDARDHGQAARHHDRGGRRRAARRRGHRRRLQAHPAAAPRSLGASPPRDVMAPRRRARSARDALVAAAVRPMEERPAGPDHRAGRGGRRPRARSACCTCTTACAPGGSRVRPAARAGPPRRTRGGIRLRRRRHPGVKSGPLRTDNPSGLQHPDALALVVLATRPALC